MNEKYNHSYTLLNDDITMNSEAYESTINDDTFENTINDETTESLIESRYEDFDDSWKIDVSKFPKSYERNRKSKANKKVKKFYKQQDKKIDNLFNTTIDDKDDISNCRAKIAIYGSFIVNVFLCITKLLAAISSQSLTVIASALDSALDIISNAVVFITALCMKKPNPMKYPIGKKRMEPLGIIVFATAMFTATIQLLTSAVQTLMAGTSQFEMSIFPMSVIGVTILLKSILFFYCNSIKNATSQTLAEDHRNDILTNTFGLCMSIVGYYYFWWLDAVGGIILSFYIMFNWFLTLMEYLSIMSGKSAPQEFISQIIVTCWNHDPRIKAIDTVRAFHLSMGYMVEVDIILEENMTLNEAHDIGESLQTKLEKHPNIDRAFVHLDYNDDHDVWNEHDYDLK